MSDSNWTDHGDYFEMHINIASQWYTSETNVKLYVNYNSERKKKPEENLDKSSFVFIILGSHIKDTSHRYITKPLI